ncbi:ABC transporter substrate-binding protein [Streptomyces ruber]|uniref:ABC transporter substrate-binding protein n=2 Tax=Streptomyces TaxID=1883 RepID=A0A918ETI6_9ACTN|nr:extracellular solute-binding protein [Streptomyces ruber]GGQ69338.1 ABC transporter substrate-binding protein [Streptomyces ruber]
MVELLPRFSAALGVVVLLAVTAACGPGGRGDGRAGADGLTVWLTVDARESWPGLVESADARFAERFPGTEVRIQYQQWGSKNQKLDAALAGDDAPDVVEMGNSEVTNYIVNGAFAPLDPRAFDRSGEWLDALAAPCRADGRTYCVPYYAGARVGIYRTDLLEKAGSDHAPRSYPELIADLDRLKKEFGTADKRFSALYLPGRDWYTAMAFVKDAGGELAAERNGRWHGTLSSPRSVAGLKTWKHLVDTYYVDDRSKDNADQPAVAGQGRAGMFYGNTWEAEAATDPRSGGNPALRGRFGTFVFPGPSGRPLPPFLGGSTLAVPVRSRRQELAAQWIAVFTDRVSQRRLIAADTLPNNTVQLRDVPADGINGPAARAAGRGWVTPPAPGWAAVEKTGVLQEMLQDIALGKQPVDRAARDADRRIDAVIQRN